MFLPIWRYTFVTLNPVMYESQDGPYCHEYYGCACRNGCYCSNYFFYLRNLLKQKTSRLSRLVFVMSKILEDLDLFFNDVIAFVAFNHSIGWVYQGP